MKSLPVSEEALGQLRKVIVARGAGKPAKPAAESVPAARAAAEPAPIPVPELKAPVRTFAAP